MIATTGTYDTRHSVHLTREARAAGADAFLVVTPYYSKPPAEGVYRHFRGHRRGRRRPPIVVYNIPQRVVHQPAARADARLARSTTWSPSSRPRPTSTRRSASSRSGLALYAGNDDLLVPFGEIGGVGGICVASHVAGERDAGAASRDATRGDMDRARALDAELRPLYDALSVTINPIPVKAAVELLGFPVGDPRLPLVAATEAERPSVRAALERRGLLARRMTDPGVVRVIPLGGIGEIGKNMTVVESAEGIVVIDAGIAFPRDEMLGVDLVLPDFAYLREHADLHPRRDPDARPRGPRRRPAVPDARGGRARGVGRRA